MMQRPDLKFIVGLAVILCVDPVWLYASSKFGVYPIADEDRRAVVVSFGIIPWVVLALAISMSRPKNVGEAALFGFLAGLMIYLFYNGTQASFSRRWRSLKTIGCDVSWGSTMCTLASVVAYACTATGGAAAISTPVAGALASAIVLSIVAYDLRKR